VLDRVGAEPGIRLLDVGTGTGRNVAIPAAQRGAEVVGVDVTPELFEHARRRAALAGVEGSWIEADAQDLPFADASFDRVTSTFGAMFAPDHRRAAAELTRVCRPGGRIAMTTWVNDGFVGEMFKLTSSFMPPPPLGVEPPPLWEVEAHVAEVFSAPGVSATIAHETVNFDFPSIEDAVSQYSEDFGPFVIARRALEPQNRWEAFIEAFSDLVRRFNSVQDGSARIPSDYFLITVERRAAGTAREPSTDRSRARSAWPSTRRTGRLVRGGQRLRQLLSGQRQSRSRRRLIPARASMRVFARASTDLLVGPKRVEHVGTPFDEGWVGNARRAVSPAMARGRSTGCVRGGSDRGARRPCPAAGLQKLIANQSGSRRSDNRIRILVVAPEAESGRE